MNCAFQFTVREPGTPESNMSSVIFVHGTGVRRESYEQSFKIVKGEIETAKPLVNVRRCLWGDRCGVKLNGDGGSIPTYNTARAVGPTLSGDDEIVALWSLLYEDPLYELRLLALRQEKSQEAIPGQMAPWTQLEKAVRKLEPSLEVLELLQKTGYEPFWKDSHASVADSGELDDALRTVGSSVGEHRAAIARAVVASMSNLALEADLPAIDASVRDKVVGDLVAALGGQERTVAGWVLAPLKGMALRLGTRYARRKRGVISDATYPGTGDILLYQTRGDEIRSFIRDEIEAASEPVTLLAHSLGGIASIDLLAMNHLPKVERLITVGSQAPLLYELNCLVSLTWNQPLPEHFPKKWLNIYDLRDMLSYLGANVFPDRVRDEVVNNGQPFPEAHSAYWSNPAVWKLIISFLP